MGRKLITADGGDGWSGYPEARAGPSPALQIDFTFDMGHYFFSHFDLLSRNCPGDIFVVEVF